MGCCCDKEEDSNDKEQDHKRKKSKHRFDQKTEARIKNEVKLLKNIAINNHAKLYNESMALALGHY